MSTGKRTYTVNYCVKRKSVTPNNVIFRCKTFRTTLRKVKTKIINGGRPTNGTKTPHTRIKSYLEGKFLHKTKKVLHLIKLYSDVTHSEKIFY